MKITDPDVIKNGEKDLIEAVKNDLDLDAVKEIIKKKWVFPLFLPKEGKLLSLIMKSLSGWILRSI